GGSVGSGYADAHPHVEPGGELDEFRYLVLQPAAPQAEPALGALCPQLGSLAGSRLPFVRTDAPPEDPVVSAAWCGVGVSVRAGQVPYELLRQLLRDRGERGGLRDTRPCPVDGSRSGTCWTTGPSLRAV